MRPPSNWVNPFKRERPLYVTCDSGLETVLADELTKMGAGQVMPGHRGVGVFGNREMLWRINVESRVANRVLVPIAEFPAASREALHSGAFKVDWSRWFRVDSTIAVDASSHKSQQNHTAFMAQVVKDGICDKFRELTGRRPSVERMTRMFGSMRESIATAVLSLDASGERLHRRGYRIATGMLRSRRHWLLGFSHSSSDPEHTWSTPCVAQGRS